jgi:hypothetical protein
MGPTPASATPAQVDRSARTRLTYSARRANAPHEHDLEELTEEQHESDVHTLRAAQRLAAELRAILEWR